MEIKLKRVPFNVDLAKKITEGEINGAKIVDGLNHSARILAYDKKGDFPIVAIIGINKTEEEVRSFTEKGTFYLCPNKEKDLHILVPVHYNDYSNFRPQKWQPCLVRNFDLDRWVARVANGEKKDNRFYILSVYGETQSFAQCLPISKLTVKLLGTTKSYEEILEEQWTSEE